MVLHFIISVVIAWTGIRSEEPSFAKATAGKQEARSKEGTSYVQNLRCEMLVNPLGIDVAKPRLSWEITGKQRNIKQTAYHILVSSSREKLQAGDGDLWNSGKVIVDQSVHVSYDGVPLEGRTECFWKVKIWTEGNEHP